MDETKKSRILIFGKNGQVGWELCRTLSTLGEIHTVDIDECDLTDKASIINTLDGFKPTVIANAAAYTAVDKAETERELAFKLNADAPAIMAWYRRVLRAFTGLELWSSGQKSSMNSDWGTARSRCRVR